MNLADRAEALLASDGPVSRLMPGFRPREPQVLMARAGAEVLERGGVLLVEAPTGCMTRDTIVPTGWGLLTFEQLAMRVGADRVGPAPLPTMVSSGTETVPCALLWNNGIQPTLLVTTNIGHEARVTPTHRFVRLLPSGAAEWIEAQALKPGDRIAIARGTELWGSNRVLTSFGPTRGRKSIRFPAELTPGLAELLGAMVADGDSNYDRIRITNGRAGVAAHLIALTEEVFGFSPKISRNSRTLKVELNGRALRQWTDAIGLRWGAARKVVPPCIATAPREIIVSFLNGLFLDTTVRDGLCFSSASSAVADFVAAALLNLGIRCTRRTRFDDGRARRASRAPNANYQASVTGARSVQQALETFTFIKPGVRENLQVYTIASQPSSNVDTVPVAQLIGALAAENGWPTRAYHDYTAGGHAPTYPSLARLWAQARPSGLRDRLETLLVTRPLWATVEAVARAEPTCVYDLTVPGPHCYVAGGFVNHNSGKGLAYLSALAGYLVRRREAKAIASTATITLQEQLVRKDLPVVSEVAGGLRSALLKGMGRYVCLVKWRGLAFQTSLVPPQELAAFARWLETTTTGDQNELPQVPGWWSEVAADHSDCLGPACSLQLQCFPLAARQAARRAQLIVTNHHLLLLHRRFGTSSTALPPDAPVVLDEAHHVSDFATEVYGESCTDFTFVALARRLHGLAPQAHDPLHRQIWAAIELHKDLMRALRPSGPDPAPLPEVAPTLREGFLAALRGLRGEIARRPWEVIRDGSGISANERAALMIRMLEGYEDAITAILDPAAGTASWVEPTEGREVTLTLRNAPIDIGGALGGLFGKDAPPAILCSATLAAGGSFAHLKAKLGIGEARELVLPSVFDHARQMRYYLSKTPLDPKAPTFTDQVAAELLGLLRASEGRALVLFTSYEQLRAVAERLRGKLHYTLLVQDERSTSAILQQFRDDVHSVLLATARFWEGVDVLGEACSLVAIVRLPFDVPTHPLARARFEAARARGDNPFATVVMPEAIINLRQGVGRLIRSTSDRGVVAILDGRVQLRSYGRQFMAALPAAPRISDHAEVAAFLRAVPVGGGRR